MASGRRRSTRGCFTNTNRAMFGGRKRTHLGTIFLILRVCRDNGLHLRYLCDDCPENTDLCLLSMKKQLEWCPRWLAVALFIIGVYFLSQLVVLVKKGVLQPRRNEAVGSSKWVCRSHLTVNDENTVTTSGIGYDVPWSAEDRLLVELTPCLCTPRQSLTPCPPRPMS